MNKKKKKIKIRRLAYRDQFMEEFKKRAKRLQRINERGPKNKKDVCLIKNCVVFTANELVQHVETFKKYQNYLP